MAPFNDRLERALSIVLTCCAVVFTGVLVMRTVNDGDAQVRESTTSGPPQRVEAWETLRSHALPIWRADAPVIIAEFADLECPACRVFHGRLQRVASADPRVGFVLLHFPLPTHRFAVPAARALECAAEGGNAAAFVDLAYAKQDSFGIKAWTEYARESGVSDTAAFHACTTRSSAFARIDQGQALGEAIKLRGTPTVIINGWRFGTVPTEEELRAAIDALARDEPPPGARTR